MQPTSDKKSQSILILEDDKSIRETLAMVLQSEGFTTVEAATCKDGIRAVDVVQPDLILLDFSLDDGDCEPVIHYLRRNRPQTPVVLISGRSDIELHAKRFEIPIVVKKPFDVDQLLEVINNGLTI